MSFAKKKHSENSRTPGIFSAPKKPTEGSSLCLEASSLEALLISWIIQDELVTLLQRSKLTVSLSLSLTDNPTCSGFVTNRNQITKLNAASIVPGTMNDIPQESSTQTPKHEQSTPNWFTSMFQMKPAIIDPRMFPTALFELQTPMTNPFCPLWNQCPKNVITPGQPWK